MENFKDILNDIIVPSRKIEGYLTPRESRFLALLAIFPVAAGEILEIGSFKGKSTVILAKGASLSNSAKIIAVDPLTSPSITDPDLKGQQSIFKEFHANLRDAGVEGYVEFHQKYSFELAQEWNRKIRFLWIDGNHTYSGTKKDFDMFSKFLSDGAIIALHDVLNPFDGPIRVFMEDILLSDKFGVVGFCGSIGWAQHLEDEKTNYKYRKKRLNIYLKLSKLIPFAVSKEKPEGIQKLRYKILRAMVLYSEIKSINRLKKIIMK